MAVSEELQRHHDLFTAIDTGRLTTMPLPVLPENTGLWLKMRDAIRERQRPADAPASPSPDAANGGDPILTTLIQAITSPATSQLPAQYSGGRVYVQSGSAGSPAALWLALAVVAAAGVWWFKFRKGA